MKYACFILSMFDVAFTRLFVELVSITFTLARMFVHDRVNTL